MINAVTTRMLSKKELVEIISKLKDYDDDVAVLTATKTSDGKTRCSLVLGFDIDISTLEVV